MAATTRYRKVRFGDDTVHTREHDGATYVRAATDCLYLPHPVPGRFARRPRAVRATELADMMLAT